MVKALASHLCGPGSNPGVDAIWGLSLLFVLSFAPRGFSPGTPVFPSPQKPTFPNSNSTRNQVDEEPLCGSATCKSLSIYYLFINQYFCLAFDNELPPIPQIDKKCGISFNKVSGDQERKGIDKLDKQCIGRGTCWKKKVPFQPGPRKLLDMRSIYLATCQSWPN